MATVRFRRNPRFVAQMDATTSMTKVKVRAADMIAKAAQKRVPAKYRYRAEASHHAGGVGGGSRVVVRATTETRAPGPLAGWLEFGGETGDGTIPALHPLRRGAADVGIKVVDRGK